MTEEAKFQTIPKKNIVIMFIAVVAYAVLFVALAFGIGKLGVIPAQVSKPSLTLWKIATILLSVYTLTTPWRWQKRIISRANQHHLSARQIWGMLILFCFVPLIAPLIYGLVLSFWGLSFVEFCYFAALSVVGSLAWSVYNWRTNP